MARTLAQAYIAVLPNMRPFGPALRRGTLAASGASGRAAGLHFSGQMIGGLRGTERGAQTAGRRAGSRFGGAMRRVLGPLITGIGGLFAAQSAIRFFKGAINEAREAARVTRLTEAVIKSTGGAAKVSAKHVADLADSLSLKSGVDDELIQNGANVLLTFTRVRNEVGKGNDIFDQGTALALDMSAALGQDMQTSVIQVGKALNDPIKGMTALRRVGVSFTEQQQEQIKAMVESGDIMGAQKIILGELRTEFGGAAEAAADPAKKAQVAWANFKEELGERMLPILNALLIRLTLLLPSILDTAAAIGNFLLPFIRLLWSSLTATIGVIAAIVGWFNQHRFAAAALGIAIGALVLVTGIHAAILGIQSGALLRYIVQLGIVRLATAAWAAVQWVLNAAFWANPITLVILAIAALVAAIIIAYRNSETFRNIVQATWHGIQVAASFAWNNILRPILDAWRFWMSNVVAPVMLWLWNNIVVPAFAGIRAAFAVWWAVASAIFNAWRFWIANVIAPVILWLWHNIVAPAFAGVRAAIAFAWSIISAILNAWRHWMTNVIAPVMLWLWRSIIAPAWNFIREAIAKAWGVIHAIFWGIINFLRGAFSPAWQAFAGFVSRKWEDLKGAISGAWNWIKTVVFDRMIHFITVTLPNKFRDMASGVVDWVKNMADRIGQQFANIADFAKRKINDLIGLINKPINFLNKTFKISLPTIPQLAVGGAIQAYPLGTFRGRALGGEIAGGPPGTDTVPAAMRHMGRISPFWLDNGEHVWTAREVERFGGQDAMYAFRAGVRAGRFTWEGAMGLALGGGVRPGMGRDMGGVPGLIAVYRKFGGRGKMTSGYRPGDPLWHGSGLAADFGGYNQDTVSRNLMGIGSAILELIHSGMTGNYGISMGRAHNMGTRLWQEHKNHVHLAMNIPEIAKILGGYTPAPASGATGGGWSPIEWLKSTIGSAARKALDALLSAFDKALPGGEGLHEKMIKLPISALKGAILDKFNAEGKKQPPVFEGAAGLAGGNLGQWIADAIKFTGVPGSWAGPLKVLIMRESGGNPRAINRTDSNAARGDPSRGLMQTIGATFSRYRDKRLPNDIYNPISNIVAGINYIKARYGSIFNVQQANPNLPPKGYDMGGLLMPGWSTVYNGTGKPENVSPVDKMDRVAELLEEIIVHLDRVGPAVGREVRGVGSNLRTLVRQA